MKCESAKISRDLDRILGANASIVGSEMALRLLGFESRCKFIFNHDGGDIGGVDMHFQTYDLIVRRKDVRYFCIFVNDSGVFLAKFLPGLKKIVAAYPEMVLVKRYQLKDTFFFLFDKYPGKKS